MAAYFTAPAAHPECADAADRPDGRCPSDVLIYRRLPWLALIYGGPADFL